MRDRLFGRCPARGPRAARVGAQPIAGGCLKSFSEGGGEKRPGAKRPQLGKGRPPLLAALSAFTLKTEIPKPAGDIIQGKGEVGSERIRALLSTRGRGRRRTYRLFGRDQRLLLAP